MAEYVKAHIFDVPYHADIEYSYAIPSELLGEISVGALIIVPFGTANKPKTAIVTELFSDNENPKIKQVKSLMNDYLSLDSDMLALCRFMKSQTLCTIGEAVRCIVPAVMATKVSERYFVSDKPSDRLSEEYRALYEYIKQNAGVSSAYLRDKHENAQEKLSWLVKNKYISRKTELEQRDNAKYESIASLAITKEEALSIISEDAPKKLRSKKHADILRLRCEFDSLVDIRKRIHGFVYVKLRLVNFNP